MKPEDRASTPPKSAGAAAAGALSFENAMERLSAIVEQLESGELPLEASLRLFEEGVALSKRAGELLDQAERKVEILTRSQDGSLAPQPFEGGENEEG